MKKVLSMVLLGAMVSAVETGAQDAAAVIDAAARAMGTQNLQSVHFSGAGAAFVMGPNARPDAPWPQFTVTKYNAGVRYDAPAFREELVRIDTAKPPRGGGAGGFSAATGQGGMRPIIGEQTQVRQLTPRNDAGYLQIWMTPHGFLKAAAANKATAGNAGGKRTLSFPCKYTVTGRSRSKPCRRVATSSQRAARRHAGGAVYSDTGITRLGPGAIVDGACPRPDITVSAVQPSAAALGFATPRRPPSHATSSVSGDGVWVITAGLNACSSVSDHIGVSRPWQRRRSHAVRGSHEARSDNPIRYLVTRTRTSSRGRRAGLSAEGSQRHHESQAVLREVLTLPHRINPDACEPSEGRGRRFAQARDEPMRLNAGFTTFEAITQRRPSMHTCRRKGWFRPTRSSPPGATCSTRATASRYTSTETSECSWLHGSAHSRRDRSDRGWREPLLSPER